MLQRCHVPNNRRKSKCHLISSFARNVSCTSALHQSHGLSSFTQLTMSVCQDCCATFQYLPFVIERIETGLGNVDGLQRIWFFDRNVRKWFWVFRTSNIWRWHACFICDLFDAFCPNFGLSLLMCYVQTVYSDP